MLDVVSFSALLVWEGGARTVIHRILLDTRNKLIEPIFSLIGQINHRLILYGYVKNENEVQGTHTF